MALYITGVTQNLVALEIFTMQTDVAEIDVVQIYDVLRCTVTQSHRHQFFIYSIMLSSLTQK